jgi:(R,R)-butanediol dehydrogenase/meso-butanediol dehydrogenase/diacetyl reductase
MIMKGLVLQGIKQLEYRTDLKKPQPKKDEVLIAVKYCGICGSDLEAYQHGMVVMPLILGHEFSGEIVELGSDVVDFKLGDRVTGYPGNFCGKCFFCKSGQVNLCSKTLEGMGLTVDGALAEYIKMPAKCLCKLPTTVSFEEAALTEPLSVGYHGVRMSGIQPDDSVVVIGAGSIGLSTIQALRLRGIREYYIVEPSEFNKSLALQMGAKEIRNPSRINGVGPDFVFDCAGFPKTYKKNLSIVRKGGTVILLGVYFNPAPIPFLQFIMKEINMRGSFGYSFEEFQEVLSLIAEGKYLPDLMISKKVELASAIQEGFLELLRPNKEVAKILVEI